MAHENRDHKTFLTCYNDTFGYGWKHVDLFVHDADGKEVNWVHWGVDADGPEAADRITAQVEPTLRRTSEWKADVSESGMEFWTAEAAWVDSAPHG
jgi:hypothetical protein